MRNLKLKATALSFLLAGSLASPALAQSSNPLDPFLQQLNSLFSQELTSLLNSFLQGDDSSPLTQTILSRVTETLGALGLPIPIQLQQVSDDVAQSSPIIISQPDSDVQKQTDYVAANTVARQATDAVLGANGQQQLSDLLSASQDAWTVGNTIVADEAELVTQQVIDESAGIQNATSTLDVVKAMARQNAALAQVHYHLGRASSTQSQMEALRTNLDSKQLILGAGQLEMEKLSANALATLDASNTAQTQGAANLTVTNALQATCLSPVACR